MSPQILVTLLGLFVGSFLNVCIYRLPRRESVVWLASHCTSCGRMLRWFENVPVLGWIALRGRCRTCHERISVLYPVIEAVTAVLFLNAWYVYGPTPLLAVRLAFICGLIVLFVIDWQHQNLPDAVTLPGVVVGLAASFLLPPGWLSSLVGMAVGGIFPFLMAEAYRRLRGRKGMGMGDFKMLAMVGAFLGWPLVWIVLIVSCVLGIVIGGGALIVTGRGMDTRIPLGTFIAVAALMGALAGGPMIHAYEQALGAYQRWGFGTP